MEYHLKSKVRSKKTKQTLKKQFTHQEIIDFLESKSPQAFKAKEMIQHMNLSKVVYQRFRQSLQSLVNQGKIIRYKKGRYGLAKILPELTGELHVKTQGYGFVRRDDGGEDVFISMKNMGTALHKDRVRVQLLIQRPGESLEGMVIEVLERARRQIVGTYRRGRRVGFVVPDELKIMRDIYVADEDTLGAKSRQKVVVEIRNWEPATTYLEGIITKVLGFPEEAGVQIESILHSYEIPEKFPPQVIRETELIPETIPATEIQQRLDLRQEMIFTIDPINSKDFDDAVSLKQLENGNWLLGVHIADVSQYIPPESALEQEAFKRGTSVYLVDRVIPMLPEQLSNQVCSLQPQQERLTYSVLMELSPAAQLLDYSFHESVIKSQRRFSYEEVQAILDGQTKADSFEPVLQQMLQLSQKLLQMRTENGSLDFDIPEAEIDLNEKGDPIQIKPSERLNSHRLIEEFMLLANQTVARHIGLHQNTADGKKLPFVYRIHEKPDIDKIKNFIEYVSALGYHLNEKKARDPKSLQKFISDITNEHDRARINKVLLRSLMKAQYSTKNVGHFGLAFKHYTHFTSPIRRYPDLMVHRLLKKYHDSTRIENRLQMKKQLEEKCKIASQREIRAQEAERESIKLKQLEFIEKFIGESYQGIVTGVVPFGIFVEIPQYLIEGLVHVNDLEPDFYVLDEKQYCLIGQNTGKIYRLGDPIEIKIARVNRNERIVDFTLTNVYRKRKKRNNSK